MIVLSSSSCPRSHGSLGAMGSPHRQHVARPAWTMGERARRRRWWLVPYPRCAVVPRALSRARVCSGHRETPGGHGTVHPCSRHGCLARAMAATSVRVVDGPHGSVAVGAVIPCAHRGGACGRDVWGVVSGHVCPHASPDTSSRHLVRAGVAQAPRRQESQSVSVPPGDTARSGHCSSGVCALCPRAVGQGATLGGTRGEIRTHTGIPFEGMASAD